jgi:hypothetical protein
MVCCLFRGGFVEEFGSRSDDRAALVPVYLPCGGEVLVAEEVGDELDRGPASDKSEVKVWRSSLGVHDPGRPALAATFWTWSCTDSAT